MNLTYRRIAHPCFRRVDVQNSHCALATICYLKSIDDFSTARFNRPIPSIVETIPTSVESDETHERKESPDHYNDMPKIHLNSPLTEDILALVCTS